MYCLQQICYLYYLKILIIYYGILNPIVNEKKAQLEDMNLKQKEIAEFNKEMLFVHNILLSAGYPGLGVLR